jgi:hypothetical protein
MKKKVDLVAVVLFLVALAVFAAALKTGHGHGSQPLFGFSSGA